MPKEYKQKPAISRGFRLPSLAPRDDFKSLNPNLLIWLAIGLLVVIILGYLGLFFYNDSLNKEKLALEIRIGDKSSERDLELEKSLRELERGEGNLKKFEEIHIFSSKLFQMLEELTLANVLWRNFSADLSKNRIDLKGQAANYNILAEEIKTLEKDPRIKKVETSGISLGAGGVNFNMFLEFNPDLLKGFVQNHEAEPK